MWNIVELTSQLFLFWTLFLNFETCLVSVEFKLLSLIRPRLALSFKIYCRQVLWGFGGPLSPVTHPGDIGVSESMARLACEFEPDGVLTPSDKLRSVGERRGKIKGIACFRWIYHGPLGSKEP